MAQPPRPNGQVFVGPLRMTSLSLGSVIDRIYQYALSLKAQEAALMAQFELSGDFEPRLLNIPGLLVTALWLKSLSQASDLVVPLNTKIPQLSGPAAKAMHTMDDFVRITKPLVVTRLSSEIYG